MIPEIYVRDCLSALDFYKHVFGGEIKNLRMSDDLELFRGVTGKVIHAELHVNARCVFYFVDLMDSQRAHPGNVALMLHLDNEREMRRVYRELSAAGRVSMKLQQNFWGDYHAIVTDRFGALWALNSAAKNQHVKQV